MEENLNFIWETSDTYMNLKAFEKMMKDCDALSGVRFLSSMNIQNENEKATPVRKQAHCTP